MSSPKKENFLEEILSYIKFPFDRDDIKSEFENHISEKIDYYISQGYDKETSEQKSISDMGDPKEIGIELNKQHNPFIGWVWKVTNIAVVVFALWHIYVLGGTLVISLFSNNSFYNIPKEDIVYEIKVDEKVKIDDTVIHFKNVIYEENGNMNIFYEYYDTKLWGTGWSLGSIGNITDDIGNEYFGGGSGGSAGGIKSQYKHTIKDFSKEADTLIINYDKYNRRYKVEIPLKAGDDNE